VDIVMFIHAFHTLKEGLPPRSDFNLDASKCGVSNSM